MFLDAASNYDHSLLFFQRHFFPREHPAMESFLWNEPESFSCLLPHFHTKTRKALDPIWGLIILDLAPRGKQVSTSIEWENCWIVALDSLEGTKLQGTHPTEGLCWMVTNNVSASIPGQRIRFRRFSAEGFPQESKKNSSLSGTRNTTAEDQRQSLLLTSTIHWGTKRGAASHFSEEAHKSHVPMGIKWREEKVLTNPSGSKKKIAMRTRSRTTHLSQNGLFHGFHLSKWHASWGSG